LGLVCRLALIIVIPQVVKVNATVRVAFAFSLDADKKS